jgi:putative cardiolipin synthase
MEGQRKGRFPALAIRRKGALHALAMLGILLAMLLQAGCASLPTDYPRSASTALTDTGDTRLGQASSRLLAEHPEVSGVLLLNRGSDALLARLALTEAAEKSLDIQYYIWHGDTTGKVMLERVLRAADRGVRVRLLLDDIGTAAQDRNLLVIDSQPNIEVRLFNPVATRSVRLLGVMVDFSRANRRMHNKSFADRRRYRGLYRNELRGAKGHRIRRSRPACDRPCRGGGVPPIRSLLE